MEAGERETAMSMSREVPIRDSGPPPSSRTFDGSHAPSWSSNIPDVSRQPPGDVWAGAISRLQTQVSLNTSMLESHRRQLQEVDHVVRDLNQEMVNVVSTLNEFRAEVRSRPVGPTSSRHDTGDLEVLAGQVESVTSKANEIDGLRLQLELMRNRMKRLEDERGPTGPDQRPSTASRDMSGLDGPHPTRHIDASHHHHPPHHQTLPPMRMSSLTSPVESRRVGLHGAHAHPPLPVLGSRNGPGYTPPMEPHQYRRESSTTMDASTASTFRPSDPLPPPTTLPGWRSSESLHHPSGLPPPPPPRTSSHDRPQTMEPEPQGSGWAPVNAHQTIKRPFEEPPRRSPYESPGSGSPKRPKLAPIMPRSSYADDSYVPSSVAKSGTTESLYPSRSRAASDGSYTQSQAILTPASASTPAYRFITSTTQADSQESWRPEHERRMHPHPHPHHHGRGRGRRGGRGHGRRGRGGGGVPLPASQEFGTPEWEKPDWSGSQVSPNGYYHPLHPYSPRGGRGGLIRRSNGSVGGPSDREHQEFPETPVETVDDATAADFEDGEQHPASGGKKTRTKPVRNAEGVLIRKDGRPDMRSVSSANNLRKVHAKKEAERADIDGRTPTSARSLAPANAFSDDEEGSHSGTPETPLQPDEAEGEEHGTQEKGHELLSRIFPHGAVNRRNVADRFFPRQEVPEADVKDEELNDRQESRQEPENDKQNGGSPMTDVVMRELSEAPAEDHRTREGDTKMATVTEVNEEPEKAGESREAEGQSVD